MPGPATSHSASAAGPASTALLRSLPVAPPRTGPVAREAAVAPPPPPHGAPGVPATFTAAEIERIRSGTGSLLERTADLFTATSGIGAAVSPSSSPSFGPGSSPAFGAAPGSAPGSAPGQELDHTTGGPAVFHQTSTDSHAVASSRPDPWRAGVPDPWTDMPGETEPTGATLDRIVDAVVERIEDRVIDELERRGRHEWRVV
ncbi:hypothetical protein KVF89_09380 [Nocardioides carbamazepini]|uniref:hypothetical protein n=1 Tax=Nocardioides carbamazepini TaxID=2854259 RepID=UPI00214A8051|nr:hypothetical protein [Nocardioides carbamazepini]MCR1782743.1 hypothetical protein [Nocardioides carbamazepini]